MICPNYILEVKYTKSYLLQESLTLESIDFEE